MCLSGSRQGAWFSTSERSAARLAHRSGGPGVGSSNLPAPTISPIRFQRLAREAEPRPICEMGMKRTQKVPRWRKKSRDNPELCCRVVRVRRKLVQFVTGRGVLGFARGPLQQELGIEFDARRVCASTTSQIRSIRSLPGRFELAGSSRVRRILMGGEARRGGPVIDRKRNRTLTIIPLDRSS